MAAIGSRVTVTANATLIASDGRYVRIKNKGTNTIDLGGPNVATGAGHELVAGGEIEVDCTVDELWGISAAAQSNVVTVLGVRRPYTA